MMKYKEINVYLTSNATRTSARKIIFLVGACATGKTSFVKQKLLPAYKNHFIIDVNNEYLEYPEHLKAVLVHGNRNLDEDNDQYAFVCDIMNKHDLVVIESVNGIVNDYEKVKQLFSKILVNSRNFNASVVMVFQSFRSIPKKYLQVVDEIYYFYRETSFKSDFSSQETKMALEICGHVINIVEWVDNSRLIEADKSSFEEITKGIR